MNPKELRIGNLISDKLSGALLEVDYISKHSFGVKVLDRSKYPLPEGWEAEPIQLTEQWLRDFGFKSTFSTDPQYWPASKCFNLKGFKIHQPIEDVDQFIFEPIVDDHIELHSVHQIQNVYFSIMGDDLVIN